MRSVQVQRDFDTVRVVIDLKKKKLNTDIERQMECWSRREELMSDTMTFRSEKELLRPFPSVGRLFQWSNPFRTLNYHGTRQPALLVIWTLLFIGYFPSKVAFKIFVSQHFQFNNSFALISSLHADGAGWPR